MKYLIAMALGPVQDFIAAARRTADLTAGSALLSEIAQTVAKRLHETHKAQLIYPATANQPSAPNRILCVIESDTPHKVANDVHTHAVQHLKEVWASVYQSLPPTISAAIDTELASYQVRNFLEFYAAWVPLNGDYVVARQAVERLLAARKATREFKQHPVNPNRPKSPLDPAYDSVFKEFEQGYRLPSAVVGKPPLYLKPRETLDAIGLIKRYWGYHRTRNGGVPSTTEMGFRALKNYLYEHALSEMRVLEEWQHKLGIAELSALLHQSRWQELKEEHRRDPCWQQFEHEFSEPERAASHARGILRYARIPDEYLSYYALLQADGDRMGQFLDTLTSIEQHQAFSHALGAFAQDAKTIVERYEGHLVYAGGDDVLALVPVNRALACAQQLAACFGQRVEEFARGQKLEQACLPTLSVGVAIVHALEHLRDALNMARAAEHAAKAAGRNRLAVAYSPRSGEAITVVLQWSECTLWHQWVNAFKQGLAGGLPYELLLLVREYEHLSQEQQRAIVRAEAERVLQRKEGHKHAPELPHWLELAHDLQHLAHLMIIARMLAVYPEVDV